MEQIVMEAERVVEQEYERQEAARKARVAAAFGELRQEIRKMAKNPKDRANLNKELAKVGLDPIPV